MIPYSNTKISILKSSVSHLYDDPAFDGNTDPARVVVQSGIRAHISTPSGVESSAQGEQLSMTQSLLCDPTSVDLNHVDGVLDETTGIVYEISWCYFYRDLLPHWEAQLNIIEGLL